MFRKIENMELYITTRKDVNAKHDYFILHPDLDESRGVRMLIK